MRALEIRRAGEADLAGIVAVILESWRRTYGDVLPAEYLAGPVEGDLKARWTPVHLAGSLVLVAVEAGRVVGVAATLPDHADGPYVDNLHVARAVEGTGVGRGLMARTARDVLEAGHRRLHLTVAEANPRAIAFYKRLGGRFGPAFEEAMFGNPVMAHAVCWDDLTGLAAMDFA